MPVARFFDDKGALVSYYKPPRLAGCLDWSSAGETKLRAIRADAARTVAEFASVKETKRHFQKTEKAATLVLNWFNAPIGLNQIKGWPVELASEIDYAFNAYDLA